MKQGGGDASDEDEDEDREGDEDREVSGVVQGAPAEQSREAE